MDLLDGDAELTEFEAIDVQSIKGVGQGANGFPILMMKGLAPEVAKGARDCPKCSKNYDADHAGSKCENCGTDLPDAPASKAGAEPDREAAKALVKAIIGKKVDETPDIAGGSAVIAQIADLIIGEAQELKAGNTGEITDIMQLAMAAEMIWTWRTGEESVASGSVMPATALMQSAAKAQLDMEGARDWTTEQVEEFTARLAEAIPGARLLPPGKTEIDTGKAAIAPEGKTVDTVTQETGGLSKAVQEAIAKATAPLQERIESLSGELAKVKATPVPGGLVLSRNVQVKQPGTAANEDQLAKAARYLELAEQVTDRVTADGYRKLAREAQEKAVTTAG